MVEAVAKPLTFTREQAERFARSHVAWDARNPEHVRRLAAVVDRMVERGECVWHAVARVTRKRCYCAPCSQRRAEAQRIETYLLSEVQNARKSVAETAARYAPWAPPTDVGWILRGKARRLRLVRWALGMPIAPWLRGL